MLCYCSSLAAWAEKIINFEGAWIYGKLILLSVQNKINNIQRVPKIIPMRVTFTGIQQSSIK